MKIELKKLKIAEHLSEETTAFSAEIFIDGVLAGYAKNSGQGGSTDYHHDYNENKAKNEKSRELIAKAEKYCLSLPEIDYGNFKLDSNLENVIDDLVDSELKQKSENKLIKKLEKKMQTCVLVGKPFKGQTTFSYSEFNFKRPLAAVPLVQFQNAINRIKAGLKPEEVILNTNLKELGIIF